MKTLKQWYDSLSEPAQTWIVENCSAWFDKNQADYYRKVEAVNNFNELESMLLSKDGIDRYSDYSNARLIANKHAALLVYLSQIQPHVVSPVIADDAICQIIEVGMQTEKTWLYISDEKKKLEGFKRTFARHSDSLPLSGYLYTIKDYEDFDLDLTKCEIPYLKTAIVDIIGKKNAAKIIQGAGNYQLARMIEIGKPNELFDELFFCENSVLTQQRKLDLLERIYANSSSLPTEREVEDFFKRIVAVDHAYLRFLYTIICRYPAIATKLYQQKKPESELTGKESTPELYRYNKELRKLFIIAHACSLERVSKVKSGTIKEVAPLLKLYGYKWNDIYDAMYPEDPYLTA